MRLRVGITTSSDKIILKLCTPKIKSNLSKRKLPIAGSFVTTMFNSEGTLNLFFLC